ncbi:MAG: aminotransferase class V-fold PLP-dependent enzyme [Chitinophagia bacterium]|nr:aminotransferase class V-fold PLP-dependent enzyme [Chitinophagia bacterium]
MDKRTFLKTTAALGAGALLALRGPIAGALAAMPANAGTDYWRQLRRGYDLPDFINLENGFYCVQPREILDKYQQHIQEVNRLGAYYMRNLQADKKKEVTATLAQLAGCTPEELVITRNTTESLDLVIAGYPWKAGDEALMAVHDYGSMLDMFQQVADRHGIVPRKITVPLNPASDEEVVAAYEQAITPRTRLLMLCHMINITGHVLPVKKICDMARSKGVLTLVDGAHAFAHLVYTIPDLGCDFYGCSLHKWLSVPLGAGLLYMRKEHIPTLWPIFAEGGRQKTDIARLNHTGTHPVATDLTIPDAIAFYHKVGPALKESRLRTLQTRWTTAVRPMKHITLFTPADATRTCAIATVGVKGKTPAELAAALMQQHKIYTVAIDNNGIKGVRVTPNIYTTEEEIDTLIHALERMV